MGGGEEDVEEDVGEVNYEDVEEGLVCGHGE